MRKITRMTNLSSRRKYASLSIFDIQYSIKSQRYFIVSHLTLLNVRRATRVVKLNKNKIILKEFLSLLRLNSDRYKEYRLFPSSKAAALK